MVEKIMSLNKVKIPQASTINEQIIEGIRARYSDYLAKRYTLNNPINYSWFMNLLDFMLHPYDERIDYHYFRNNHIISLWDSDDDAIDFLIDNIVIKIGKDFNLFDYYFQLLVAI